MQLAAVAKSPLEILVSSSQAAHFATLEGALAAAAAGDTILVGPGTYSPPATLLLDQAGVTLKSTHGPHATKINVPLANVPGVRISASRVRLGGFEIDGRGAAQPAGTGADGIVIEGEGGSPLLGVQVEDCYVHDVGRAGNGVQAFWTDDLVIRRCRIDNHATSPTTWGGKGTQKGVYVIRSNRNRIEDCDLSGWSQAVGWWTGVRDSVLLNSRLIANYGFEDDAQTISRSAFEDYSNGVEEHGGNAVLNCLVDGSAHCCFEIAQGLKYGGRYVGNTLRNAATLVGRASSTPGGCFAVVELDEPAQRTQEILVAGNHCYSTAGAGILDVNLVQARRVSVHGNFFYGYRNPGQAALGVFGDHAVSILGNQFRDCATGIDVTGGNDTLIGSGNMFTGTGNDGADAAIHISAGTGIQVDGVLIRTTNGKGVVIASGSRISVRNSTIIVPTWAVVATAIADLDIHGCYLEETGAGAFGCFNLDGACVRADIRGNRTNNPARTGYFSATTAKCRFEHNWCIGASGINVTDLAGGGSTNTVSNNYT